MQNTEENKKAIVLSESNKNPPGKRKKGKGVSKKNDYFDVLTSDLFICTVSYYICVCCSGLHFVIVFHKFSFLPGELYGKGGAAS